MKKSAFLSVVCLWLSVFVFTCSVRTYAVPAYPYKIMVTTCNNKAVAIYMRGDEYQKFAVTEDGYTLMSDSSGWWYACLAEDGRVAKSGFALMAAEDESVELKQFKASCPKGIVPEGSVQNRQNAPMKANAGNNVGAREPIVGERRALVILMQFTDVAFRKTKEDFEALFNTPNYSKGGATGSVKDFYSFASQGQLDYVSDVYGPYTSVNAMRYYGGNAAGGGGDMHPLELCLEAIKSLPSNIDFSVYDNDKDGLVDNVHIIYAGYGEEAGASSNAIWAHEYPHRIPLRNEVGYSFAGYSCSPELRGNSGSDITYIGVICHELGHALGAMDYYDTNYATGGEYVGTGKWDIMAGGSWNDNGRTPPNFNPYVRSTVFGWNSQILLPANQNVSMPRMEKDNPDESVIYRMETGSLGDYFLLENRQRHNFDAALPGEGLIIYHVHPNIDRYNSTNTVNATSPQGLYPVCASYSEPGKKKYGNINSAECPFPGSKNVRAFSPTTSPAAVAWNGSSAKVSLSGITQNSFDGTVTFSTAGESGDEPVEPEQPTDSTLIYTESFETGFAKRMTVNDLSGKDSWRTYTKGNFVINPELVPEATDGSKILMLYSPKSNIISESEAVSPNIKAEPGATYVISFDVYCEATTASIVPTFSLYVEDEFGEYNVYTLNEPTTEWNSVNLPLTFAGDKFRYKLYARVYTGGVFVDNVKIYWEEDPTSVADISVAGEQSREVYGIDGTRLGKSQYRRGINIVRNPDGSTYKVLAK